MLPSLLKVIILVQSLICVPSGKKGDSVFCQLIKMCQKPMAKEDFICLLWTGLFPFKIFIFKEIKIVTFTFEFCQVC